MTKVNSININHCIQQCFPPFNLCARLHPLDMNIQFHVIYAIITLFSQPIPLPPLYSALLSAPNKQRMLMCFVHTNMLHGTMFVMLIKIIS